MIHEGRSIVRLNDKTDHGGYVISASSGTTAFGLEAAVANDMTFCPKCKGNFPIIPASNGATHMGQFYAYNGDSTACGAKLIASL